MIIRVRWLFFNFGRLGSSFTLAQRVKTNAQPKTKAEPKPFDGVLRWAKTHDSHRTIHFNMERIEIIFHFVSFSNFSHFLFIINILFRCFCMISWLLGIRFARTLMLLPFKLFVEHIFFLVALSFYWCFCSFLIEIKKTVKFMPWMLLII